MKFLLTVIGGLAFFSTNTFAFMPEMEVGAGIELRATLNARYRPIVRLNKWMSATTTLSFLSQALDIPQSGINGGLFTENRAIGVRRILVEYDGGLNAASVISNNVQVQVCDQNHQITTLALNQYQVSLNQINQVKIDFAAGIIPDVSQIKIRVTGIQDYANRILPETSRTFYALKGDMNNNRITDAEDFSNMYYTNFQCSVQPGLCTMLTSANQSLTRFDYNADFSITGADVSGVDSVVQDGQAVGFGHNVTQLNCF